MTEGTFRVTTLGCKVNKADSIDLEKHFFDAGYMRATSDEVPEIWVINTCAVTSTALQKSRKTVRKCMKAGSKVIVTGCGVDFSRNEFDEMGPFGIFPNREKDAIVPEVCNSESQSRKTPLEFKALTCRVPLKVQDGCKRACSYCVVPDLRISPWCMEKETVIEKVKFYKDRGVGEIILCGIDIGSYLDSSSGAGLVELIGELTCTVEGIWIRLSSISPKDINGGLIELLKSGGSFCRHLHIPLQSGSDKVLADMNRRYSAAEYKEKVDLIRDSVSDISITTDILTGFPTEDEDAFEDTVGMIGKVGFSKVHVFKYSPRIGTGSYGMGDPVTGVEKKRRSQVIAREAGRSAEIFNERFVGRRVAVLIEEAFRGEQGLLTGRTQWYSEVRVPGRAGSVGEVVDVMIDGMDGFALKGEIVRD